MLYWKSIFKTVSFVLFLGAAPSVWADALCGALTNVSGSPAGIPSNSYSLSLSAPLKVTADMPKGTLLGTTQTTTINMRCYGTRVGAYANGNTSTPWPVLLEIRTAQLGSHLELKAQVNGKEIACTTGGADCILDLNALAGVAKVNAYCKAGIQSDENRKIYQRSPTGDPTYDNLFYTLNCIPASAVGSRGETMPGSNVWRYYAPYSFFVYGLGGDKTTDISFNLSFSIVKKSAAGESSEVALPTGSILAAYVGGRLSGAWSVGTTSVNLNLGSISTPVPACATKISIIPNTFNYKVSTIFTPPQVGRVIEEKPFRIQMEKPCNSMYSIQASTTPLATNTLLDSDQTTMIPKDNPSVGIQLVDDQTQTPLKLGPGNDFTLLEKRGGPFVENKYYKARLLWKKSTPQMGPFTAGATFDFYYR